MEKLFRSVLEQSDPIPGEHVRNELMKRLARREFVRFNPSRFNIYYLAGIVAAAVTAAVLLISGPARETDSAVTTEKIQTVIELNPSDLPANSGTVASPAPSEAIPPAEAVKVDNGTNRARKVTDTSVEDKREVTVPVKTRSGVYPDTALTKTLSIDNLPGIGNKAELQRRTSASFDASSQSGCIPLKVSFRNNSQAYDSCRWIFGDGGSSDNINPVWIFDRAGEFKVTLIVYGQDGAEVTESMVVNVYPRPEARFEFQPEKPIIPDDAVRFMNYSVDAVKFRWDFGDGKTSVAYEPEHKYDRYGSYDIRLIVWSDHGCSDSVTVVDALAGSGCYIDFPNAFIPNPDGPSGGYYTQKSDEGAQIFHPVTSGVSEFQLRIFSKIGILIFESNDINIGWDGYHKGQLCEPGVYIWKVRGIYKNGEPFVKMGDITLLKR